MKNKKIIMTGIIIAVALFFTIGGIVYFNATYSIVKKTSSQIKNGVEVGDIRKMKKNFEEIKTSEEFKNFKKTYNPSKEFLVALLKDKKYELASNYEILNFNLKNTDIKKQTEHSNIVKTYIEKVKITEGKVPIEEGKKILGELTDIGIIFSNLEANEAKKMCLNISKASQEQCIDNYYFFRAKSKEDCNNINDERRKKICVSVFE